MTYLKRFPNVFVDPNLYTLTVKYFRPGRDHFSVLFVVVVLCWFGLVCFFVASGAARLLPYLISRRRGGREPERNRATLPRR